MKKTLITLLALGGMAMADATFHDITFTSMPTGAMQNVNPKDLIT